MKAVYLESVGGPEVLQYGEVPDPIVGPRELLIRIKAASINGADWKVRRGIIPNAAKALEQKPHYVLGRDFCGIVEALGTGLDNTNEKYPFQVGDRVFGVCEEGQEGTYCEKIAMKADLCAKAPEGVSDVDLCALALTSITAIVCLEESLQIQPNERVLITGGAGGVGHLAIGLAHHLGASSIVTTTSTPNLSYVRAAVPSSTALRIIDYTQEEDLAEALREEPSFDAILDTVGGAVATSVFPLLKPKSQGGRAAFIASGPKAPIPPMDQTSLRPKVYRSRKHLEKLGALLRKGALPKPEIRLFALEEAVEAHRISESRHFRGKLVFVLQSDD